MTLSSLDWLLWATSSMTQKWIQPTIHCQESMESRPKCFWLDPVCTVFCLIFDAWCHCFLQVSTWMMTRQNFEDEMSFNQANEAFLQVEFCLLSMIQLVILLLSVLFECVVYFNVLVLCKCCRFAPRPQT